LKLTAELTVLNTTLNQAKNDKDIVTEDLKILSERITSTYNACRDAIDSFVREIKNIVEETDIVKKVIEIFEANAI